MTIMMTTINNADRIQYINGSLGTRQKLNKRNTTVVSRTISVVITNKAKKVIKVNENSKQDHRRRFSNVCVNLIGLEI
jgi:hypothetical protein